MKMFSLNRVEIIGYQTQPVVLRQTPSGASVTDLNIIVPYTFRTEKGEMIQGKSFHTVTVWGGMADVAGQYVRPGSQVFISGRLQTDSWDDSSSGEKRSKTKIVAMDLIMLDPKSGQSDAPTGSESILSYLNRAEVIGNVTRDPEVRTTTSGQSVVTIGIATNEKWKDKASGEFKERVEFHNVVLWSDLAKAVASSVKKGQRMFVAGRVQTRTWETKEGQKRATTEIIAESATLLGIRNAEAQRSVASSGERTSAGSSTPEVAAVGAPRANPVPEISYTSEIKPEDLPF
jgi:single-strand DNA-binding protein